MTTGDVTVIIPVFGDPAPWTALVRRAARSAHAQTVRPKVVISHADDLATARNMPAQQARTEWLIFLDADDELDPRYVAAMLAGGGDLRQPATLGIVNGVEDDAPVVIPARNLLEANYIVIGAMVRTALFLEVGGFRSMAAWEDWDLWIRCWLAGAQIVAVPEAVYRVHIRPLSRNVLVSRAAGAIYHQVRSLYAGQQPRRPLCAD